MNSPVSFHILTSLILTACICGCEDKRQSDSDQANETAEAELAQGDSGGTIDSDNEGMLDSVNELYEKAKKSGATHAKNASEWVAESYEKASSQGKNLANGTSDWVEQAYQKSKAAGTTTATNATEWVRGDIEKIGAYQYKIVTIDVDDHEQAAKTLNELGGDRWDCFWVERGEEGTDFYFKKSTRSLIGNLPARELIRIVPMLGDFGGGDGGP